MFIESDVPVLKANIAAPAYVAFSTSDFEQEAAALLDEAKRRAEATLGRAQEQGAAARDTGFDIGVAEGRELGYREGFAQGMEAGREQAYDASAATVTDLLLTLETILQTFDAAREELTARATTEVTPLAIAIAARVCKRAGQFDANVCAENAAAALRLVIRAHDVKLYVNPQDAQHMRSLLPALARRFPAMGHVELCEDAALAPGGCRVHTAGGLVDADLQTQLDRIAADLVPAPSGPRQTAEQEAKVDPASAR